VRARLLQALFITAKALPVIDTMIVMTIQVEAFCTAVLPLS
jgi:hypothetical protein